MEYFLFVKYRFYGCNFIENDQIIVGVKMDYNVKNTLMETLGINVVSVSNEGVVATMPVDHRTHQPFGLLHGGLL